MNEQHSGQLQVRHEPEKLQALADQKLQSASNHCKIITVALSSCPLVLQSRGCSFRSKVLDPFERACVTQAR